MTLVIRGAAPSVSEKVAQSCRYPAENHAIYQREYERAREAGLDVAMKNGIPYICGMRADRWIFSRGPFAQSGRALREAACFTGSSH